MQRPPPSPVRACLAGRADTAFWLSFWLVFIIILAEEWLKVTKQFGPKLNVPVALRLFMISLCEKPLCEKE